MKYLKYFVTFSVLWLFFTFSMGYMTIFIFDTEALFNFMNAGSPILGWVYILSLIIFPLLLSYWVLSRVKSFKDTKKGLSRTVKINLSVLSVFVLVFLLVFVLPMWSGQQNSKTSLVSINEKEEFEIEDEKEGIERDRDNTVPLTKKIDGDIYELKELGEPRVPVLYRNGHDVFDNSLPVEVSRLKEFHFYPADNVLITIEDKSYEKIANVYELISFITSVENDELTDRGEDISKKGLYVDSGLYSSTKILDYFSEEGAALLETFGGDGCAGTGKIWKLSEELESTLVTDISRGCVVENSSPRYLGYFDNSLILAEASDNLEVSTVFPPLESIYSLNPVSFETQQILFLNDLSEEITYSELEGNIVKLYDKSRSKVLYRYDLRTDEFIN